MAELRQIAVDGRRIAEAVKSVEEKTIYTAGDNVTITNGVISASGGSGGVTNLYRHNIQLTDNEYNFTFTYYSQSNVKITTLSALFEALPSDVQFSCACQPITDGNIIYVITEIVKLYASSVLIYGIKLNTQTGVAEVFQRNIASVLPDYMNDYVTEIT